MINEPERGTPAPSHMSGGQAAAPLGDAPPAPTAGRWHPGSITRRVRATRVRGDVLWSEGVRALLCMVPMLLADALGKEHAIGPLGQAGFFMSALFLPRTLDRRLNMTLILMTVGGGFYLLGGNVVDTPWLALAFTLVVGIIASFMTAWEYGYILALGFTMIFCAGINSGSPERAAENFDLFTVAVVWGGAIALLPFWRSLPAPPRPALTQAEYAEQGVRIGFGAAVALAVSYSFGFAKLGWAPSAVSSIVRYEGHVSRINAFGRAVGTLLGGAVALLILLAIERTSVFVLVAVVFTILNALFKATEVGGIPLVSVPFLHTVALVLMLSAERPETGPALAAARVGTNELGIVIGLLVIFYPLPLIMRLVRHIHSPRSRPREDPGLPQGASGNPREFKE